MIDGEAYDFTHMLGLLEKVCVSGGRGDVRIWKPNVKGELSIMSLYNVLTIS